MQWCRFLESLCTELSCGEVSFIQHGFNFNFKLVTIAICNGSGFWKAYAQNFDVVRFLLYSMVLTLTLS